MFFSKKYTITFLNSKWETIKSNIKLISVPQKSEYIYMDDKYYDVLNVVHSLNGKHQILVVIEETNSKYDVNSRLDKKN
jgi:translation elongation factor P/translation initiation factor 5A